MASTIRAVSTTGSTPAHTLARVRARASRARRRWGNVASGTFQSSPRKNARKSKKLHLVCAGSVARGGKLMTPPLSQPAFGRTYTAQGRVRWFRPYTLHPHDQRAAHGRRDRGCASTHRTVVAPLKFKLLTFRARPHRVVLARNIHRLESPRRTRSEIW